MWLAFYQNKLPPSYALSGYCSLEGVGLPKGWIDRDLDGSGTMTLESSQNITWCIVRDPVERFISAFTDKVLREKLAPWNIEDCLSMLESGAMDYLARAPGWSSYKKAARHLLGQSVWLGTDKGVFDHVFHINHMDEVREFCEDMVFKCVLPKFHARNQTFSHVDKVTFRKCEISRLESAFAADYLAGWC